MPNYIHNVKVKEPMFCKNSIEGRINTIDNFEDYKKLFSKSCGNLQLAKPQFSIFIFLKRQLETLKNILK